MTLARPRAAVSLDGRRLTSAEAALVRARVSLALGGHDAVELLLWPSSKFADAAIGATLTVALGEEGEEEDVWSGEVAAALARPDAVTLEGVAATIALSRKRVSQTFLSQSVAEVVRDLASDIAIDEVQADTQLDAYSVDDRRTVWAHLTDLAHLVGADLGSSASGGLRFVPPRQGVADVKLRYGADILQWSAGSRSSASAPAVAAYGAASEAGAEQWHWLKRTPTAMGGAGGPLRVEPALRTRDAADAVAKTRLARSDRAKVTAKLLVTGRPDVRPGALVEAAGLPTGDPGTLRVTAVEHVLDAREGFLTALAVEGAGDGGGFP